MPIFSDYFSLGLSQHQLDFVDISNEYDTRVYVDPYAIEIRDDVWAAKASAYIRTFFLEVLTALRSGDDGRAVSLMSHMQEPKETFLGESKGRPQGRGVGHVQARQLINAIKSSKAYSTGQLSDLSEMSLFVDGIDKDKISDLTTNIIRRLLVEYTQEQCELHDVDTKSYNGPAIWHNELKNWVAAHVDLPYIDRSPVLLVPKYIVRRRLSLNSQEFYNRQVTDFLIAENLSANTSLVQMIKGGTEPKVYKKDVRRENPKSKGFLTDMAREHPEILDEFKEIAKRHSVVTKFTEDEDELTMPQVCTALIEELPTIPTGKKNANRYHKTMLGALTALFYPDLVDPHKEWEVQQGRKRIDIVYANAADTGFFAQRRDNSMTLANAVIVECKNYSDDIANEEVDQLLGRFDDNRGKFGIITCRAVDNQKLLNDRCIDISSRQRGWIIVLTDADVLEMLEAKRDYDEGRIQRILRKKFRILLQ